MHIKKNNKFQYFYNLAYLVYTFLGSFHLQTASKISKSTAYANFILCKILQYVANVGASLNFFEFGNP